MEQAHPAASSSSPSKPQLADRLGPVARQTWINLKAWAPFFRNPQERDRLAKYPCQDYRTGLKWRIVLPKLCWHCQKSGDLVPQEFEATVRAFEHALGVVAGVLAAWMLAALISCFQPVVGLFMFVFLTAIGGGVLMLKSWQEPAVFVAWTCKEHRDPPDVPELAIEDGKMFVLCPAPELARAAEAEILAMRKRGPGSASGPSGGGSMPPSREPSGPPDAPIRPYSPPPPVVQEELPPIRLAGEDDE